MNVEISEKGAWVRVSAYQAERRTVVVTGSFPSIARVHDEEWDDQGPLADVPAFLGRLKAAGLRADIFTFAQPFTEPEKHHRYLAETEDVAAARLTTYSAWWESLPQESRKNVRRAEKRGVTVKPAAFDEELVRGIKAIYDEAPIRQGRPFWHYGKDLAAVRRDNSSYNERADFVGAYFEGKLIGFIKMVRVGSAARIMQILSMNEHFDKRPPNALLAKAVEVCCAGGASHLIYGQYFYGNKGHTSVTEFKLRNGFARMAFPRYYVPLTAKGRLLVGLRLHRGAKRLIPGSAQNWLLAVRARLRRRRSVRTPAQAGLQTPENHA